MSSSVFARLQYNFDDTKFGGAIYLTDGAKNYLNAAPATVTSWQQEDMANNVVSRSRYYKNPHADVIITLTSNVTTMNTLVGVDPANTFPSAQSSIVTFQTSLTNFGIELSKFKSHVDNISGLTTATENSDTIPTLDLATALGQQVLRITNVTDDIANATPMLGSFTSLFIGDELSSNNTTIYNDRITLNGTFSGGLSNATNSQINTMISHITTANTMIATRRLADWTFYTQSRAIVDNYNFVSRFNAMGNTQTNLVNNYIGTDLLKANLANT